MINISSDDKVKYWDGGKNKAIRFYFYTQKGLTLLNEFRYLLMAVFAVYFALKIDNILLIPLMVLMSVPVLMFFGWLAVYKIDRVIEFLNTRFATHFTMYNIRLQEDKLAELKTIRQMIEGLVDTDNEVSYKEYAHD